MNAEEEYKQTLQGVKTVELYKLIWSKYDQYILFAGLILLSWAISWETNIGYALNTNVTSLFKSNNLISLLPTVLYILETALFPIYSKISDIYGRAQCYTVALIFYMVSYIVMATANNYSTLVGGQVIYAFGYSGALILGPITIGDLTTVVNRGLFQALYNLPSLINIFTAPRAGAALFADGQWRWGYGMIPILLFVTGLPIVGTLWKLDYKTHKSGLLDEYKKEKARINTIENRSFFQKFIWLMIEIDIIGSLLLVAGLCLILLPLVLALPSWGGWTSGITLGTLISGVVAWGLFAIWEWKFAQKPIIPLSRWKTRTPIYGILALSTITVISSTNWQYFTTYLMISRKIDVDTAVYLERGYNVAYILCEVLVGYLMKRTKVWRPFVWTGVSLTILGVGLMIPARLPSSSDAFVVISQTIVGIGSGFLYTPMLVAIQSALPHDDLAIATAMMQVGGAIAGSIGSTMAGTIWNNMLPGQIAKNVPGDYDYASIVGSITYVTALPLDQYNGVVQSYGYIQKILSIISICICSLTFAFTIPMKSFGLEDHKEENQGQEKLASFVGSEQTDIEKTDTLNEFKPENELRFQKI